MLEEIAMYEDDPQELIFDMLGETIFPDDPLGRATLGRAEVVGAATREELMRFHRSATFPVTIVIAAAGSGRARAASSPGPPRRSRGGSAAATGRRRRSAALAAPAERSLSRRATPSSTT